jgi:hypothetical protein
MQNLLTSEYKKNVSRLYHGRVFTVGLFMVCAITLISLILLVTLSFLLYTSSSVSIEKVAPSDKNTNKNAVKSDYDSFFKDLSLLPVNSQNLNFSDVLDQILSKKETGIYLRDFSFSGGGNKDGFGTVTLRGTAATRSLLVSFTEALRKEPLFLSVDSPVSNLLKEQNLDFSLMIILKQATTTNEKKS